MFGSISDGLALLGLGSTAFTTGSAAADGGTNALAALLGGFNVIVNQIAGATGS